MMMIYNSKEQEKMLRATLECLAPEWEEERFATEIESKLVDDWLCGDVTRRDDICVYPLPFGIFIITKTPFVKSNPENTEILAVMNAACTHGFKTVYGYYTPCNK